MLCAVNLGMEDPRVCSCSSKFSSFIPALWTTVPEKQSMLGGPFSKWAHLHAVVSPLLASTIPTCAHRHTTQTSKYFPNHVVDPSCSIKY